MKMSQLESLVGPMTFRGVRDSGRIISQNLFSWNGVRWNWCNAVAPEIVFGAGDSPYNYIARIIRGDHHVYTIGSPIYPATSAYDNLREETTAVLEFLQIALADVLIGYLEGIAAKRGIAWRLADSLLALRRFVDLWASGWTSNTPDHSTISRTRRLWKRAAASISRMMRSQGLVRALCQTRLLRARGKWKPVFIAIWGFWGGRPLPDFPVT